MGFSDALINVHRLLQLIFALPYYYNISANRVEVHAKRKLCFKKRLIRMPLWGFMYLVITSLWIYCISSLNNLAAHFNKNQSSNHFLQVIVYMCAIAATTQYLATSYTIDKNPFYFMKVVREIFQFAGVRCNGLPTTERPPDFQEIMGYGITIGLLNFPFAMMLVPFRIPDVDPFAGLTIFGVPDIARKIVCSVFYCVFGFYGASICASFLLLILTCCEFFEKATHINLNYCNQQQWKTTISSKN